MLTALATFSKAPLSSRRLLRGGVQKPLLRRSELARPVEFHQRAVEHVVPNVHYVASTGRSFLIRILPFLYFSKEPFAGLDPDRKEGLSPHNSATPEGGR